MPVLIRRGRCLERDSNVKHAMSEYRRNGSIEERAALGTAPKNDVHLLACMLHRAKRVIGIPMIRRAGSGSLVRGVAQKPQAARGLARTSQWTIPC
jgi:hypothetical protein